MMLNRFLPKVRIAARVFLVLSLLWSGGCTELAGTVRILNVALIELFRLPVYMMKLPFQIIQSLGPAIQAGIRSAANMAPLLLLIERDVPKDTLFADGKAAPMLEERIRAACASPETQPILPLLAKELRRGGGARFTLIDSRLAAAQGVRQRLANALEAGDGGVDFFMVDAADIFCRRGEFLGLCERMRQQGASFYAITAFNDDLAALTGMEVGAMPDEEGNRRHIAMLSRAVTGQDYQETLK